MSIGRFLQLVLLAVTLVVLFVALNMGGYTNRDHAYLASCQSNEKQIGLALIQYSQDADGKFPSGNAGGGAGWAGQIYAYTKSIGLYKCPLEPGQAAAVSYGMNSNLAGRSATTMPNAASIVLLFEVSGNKMDASNTGEVTSAAGVGLGALHGPGSYATGKMGWTQTDAGDTSTCRHQFRRWFLVQHVVGSIFLAADGHVKFLRPEQVSPGTDAETSGDDETAIRACATGGLNKHDAKLTFSTL